MNRPIDSTTGIPPECAPTLARIQRVLDGEAPPDFLAPDSHAESCRSCRERLGAARLLVSSLTGVGSIPVPSWLPSAIVAEVAADRRSRSRRRVFAVAGTFAAAAAIVVAVWVMAGGEKQAEVVEQQPVPAPPPPQPQPQPPTPAAQPIRIDDELAKAGGALRDTSRVLTEPLESAPRLLGGLTDALLKPATFTVSADLEPARKSLAEIPEAARTGLEPVTGSAQKAFDRLLRDVTAIQPGKPKL